MPLQINEQQPRGTKWKNQFLMQPTGTLQGMQYAYAPLFQGEVGYVRGILEGLAAYALDGTIDLVLHEGLATASGTLTTYAPRARILVEAYVTQSLMKLGGVAAQLPKSDLRMRVTYQTTWLPEK